MLTTDPLKEISQKIDGILKQAKKHNSKLSKFKKAKTGANIKKANKTSKLISKTIKELRSSNEKNKYLKSNKFNEALTYLLDHILYELHPEILARIDKPSVKYINRQKRNFDRKKKL